MKDGYGGQAGGEAIIDQWGETEVPRRGGRGGHVVGHEREGLQCSEAVECNGMRPAVPEVPGVENDFMKRLGLDVHGCDILVGTGGCVYWFPDLAGACVCDFSEVARDGEDLLQGSGAEVAAVQDEVSQGGGVYHALCEAVKVAHLRADDA